MMSNSFTVLDVIIPIATIFCSVTASAFVAGNRSGRIEQAIQSQNERLAKIEGLFEMKLKND